MNHWRDSERFDEADRLVLEFTETLTLHNRVDDDLYARLEQYFERRQLVRLAMTIALAGMVNRIHATFDTEVDEATLARQ
ncbi:MAG: hypothetical protein U5R48_10380 [Gammaproteobacteria bacterium]|nr:hypothetical protein [Gammaproteobacteria bacterium]